MLSWGDWELVVTVTEENLSKLENLMHEVGCAISVVGVVLKGSGIVWVREGRRRGKLNLIANERFTRHSYYSHGLENYFTMMCDEPLILENESTSI